MTTKLALYSCGTVALVLLSAGMAWAGSGGTLSGIVKDSSGGVVQGAKLTAVNTFKAEFKATSDDHKR
jgi:hypothetical protein